MTKSADKLPQTTAFATLRFRGDRLDPDRITAILGVRPTKAYRTGERYFAGPRGGYVTGRTGVWVLATDGVVAADDLDRHLEHLLRLLFGGADKETRLRQLHELMSANGIEADVSCFWRGGPGSQLPSIEEEAISRLRELPARIETDFEVDGA